MCNCRNLVITNMNGKRIWPNILKRSSYGYVTFFHSCNVIGNRFHILVEIMSLQFFLKSLDW